MSGMHLGVNIGHKANQFFQTDRDILNAQRIETKRSLPKEQVGFPVEFNNKVLAMVHHPNKNEELFLAHAGNVIRWFDTKNNETIAMFKGHTAPVTCIHYFNFGEEEYLVSGSWDKKVIVWNLKDQSINTTYQEHSDFIKCVSSFTKDNKKYIVSGSSDKDIRIYAFKHEERSKVLKGHIGTIEDIKISYDNKTLYSCSGDRKIIEWNLQNNKKDREIIAHETTIYKLFLTLDDELFSCSADKTIKKINLEQFILDSTINMKDHVRCCTISNDNQFLFSGGRDELVSIYDLLNDKFIGSFHGHWDEITSLCFDHKNQTIFSCSLDGSLRRWKLKDLGTQPSFEQLKPLSYSNNEIIMTEEEERELEELLED